MKNLICISFILVPVLFFGQNYFSYQKTFNQIDKDISFKNYDLAKERIDSIYNQFDFIYAQHCLKALQICCKTKDSVRANIWLQKSFKQGIPLWIISTNNITREALQFKNTQKTIVQYDSFHQIYKSSINLEIARKIDSLFIIDQAYTDKVNNGFSFSGIPYTD